MGDVNTKTLINCNLSGLCNIKNYHGQLWKQVQGDSLHYFNVHSVLGIYNSYAVDSDGHVTDYLSECLDTGVSCSQWVIDYGNMDYLKVGSDGKCSDGTNLNWSTKTYCK